MVVKNLLPIYHKYLFTQYFSNFKTLIAARTQIDDAINNGTIKNDDPPRFKKNVGSNSKAAEVSNIHKNDPYQLIAPIALVPVSHSFPTRRSSDLHHLCSFGPPLGNEGRERFFQLLFSEIGRAHV